MATTTTAAPMVGLHAFQRDLLHTVAIVGQAKGQHIKHALETEYEQSINHGRLYPNLDDLDEMGLIKKTDGVDQRSNSYQVTDRGLRELEAQLEFTKRALE